MSLADDDIYNSDWNWNNYHSNTDDIAYNEHHHRTYKPTEWQANTTYTVYQPNDTKVKEDIMSRIVKQSQDAINVISINWKEEPKNIITKTVEFFNKDDKTIVVSSKPVLALPAPPTNKETNVVKTKKDEIIDPSNAEYHNVSFQTNKLTDEEIKAYKIICQVFKKHFDGGFMKIAEILRAIIAIKAMPNVGVVFYVDMAKIKEEFDFPKADLIKALNKEGYVSVLFREWKHPSILDYYRDNYRK